MTTYRSFRHIASLSATAARSGPGIELRGNSAAAEHLDTNASAPIQRDRSPLQQSSRSNLRRTVTECRRSGRTAPGRGHGRDSVSVAVCNGNTNADVDKLKGWNDHDVAPTLPAFIPSRPAGAYFPDNFQPANELDFFELFFTPAVLQDIVDNTNGYAAAQILAKPSYQSADGSWQHTDVEELRKLLGIIIYMGIVKLPHMKHYWSTAPLFQGTWARAMIPRYLRFRALLTFLHIEDYAKEDQSDKLRKVRRFYDQFCKQCQKLYQPRQNIAIDERMVKSKARFSFKQYIKNKPVKFGFKVFALCDSSSSYLVNFKIYTGRENPQQSETGLASSVVLELMSPFSGQGYHLFTDNFYTSPSLYIDLRDNHKTYAVGTCQVNRKGFSSKLKDGKQFQKKAKRNDMRYVRKENLLQQQWMDKRCVTMVSSIHSATDFVNENRTVKINHQLQDIVIKKPKAVHEYNQAMGGVDLFDQRVASYRILHKTKKFWKTLFFDFVDVAIVNAFLLYKEWVAGHPGGNLNASCTQLDFRLAIVRLLGGIGGDDPVPMSSRRSSSAPRVTSKTPESTHKPQNLGVSRNCFHCGASEKHPPKSVYACSHCKNRLGNPANFCLLPDRNCFEQYHKSMK